MDRWLEGWVEKGEGMVMSFLAQQFPAHAATHGPKRCIYTQKTHFVKLLLGLPQYRGSTDVDIFA